MCIDQLLALWDSRCTAAGWGSTNVMRVASIGSRTIIFDFLQLWSEILYLKLRIRSFAIQCLLAQQSPKRTFRCVCGCE